jgi:spore coat protein X
MSKWQALSSDAHPVCNDNDTVNQDADQVSDTTQVSKELIIIKDSEGVEIRSTDTQAAVNVQAALQVAIALVISISIADSARAERVTQDLLQRIQVKQINHQKVVIENSRQVSVTTTDTDIAVNVQLLLQILLALVAKLEVL